MDLIAWYQTLGDSGKTAVRTIALRHSSRIKYRRDELKDLHCRLEGHAAWISAGDTRKLVHWLESDTV